jgi:6-phosphofructokinase 1
MVEEHFPQYDVRVTILGHIQRGGSPTAYDRILASRLGVAAVEALLDDQQSVMVGIASDSIELTPFSRAIKYDKEVNTKLLDTIHILSS